MQPVCEYLNPELTTTNLDRYVMRTVILRSLKRELCHFHGKFLDVGAGNQPYKPLVLSEDTQVKSYYPLDLAVESKYLKAEHTWDGIKMPFEDNYFDSAMATEVLEHCPEPEVTLKEISRVLKPGGFFFFTVPFLWPLHECPYDEYRYTPWSIERHLVNSGFVDVEVRPTAGWDAALAQMMGLWLKRKPMSKRLKDFLSWLALPLYRKLIEMDRPISHIGHHGYMMPGLSGTARKKSVETVS